MRFAVLSWFLGSSNNGPPAAWLLKQAHSHHCYDLKNVAPLRTDGIHLQSSCVSPCHATGHLGGAFFAKQGFLYLQRLLLWVRPVGFGDCLILPVEWKWDVLSGKHFFYFLFFPLWWNSHVISLLSQWLMLHFYAINFSLSSAFISDNFIHCIFQASFLKCEEES